MDEAQHYGMCELLHRLSKLRPEYINNKMVLDKIVRKAKKAEQEYRDFLKRIGREPFVFGELNNDK